MQIAADGLSNKIRSEVLIKNAGDQIQHRRGRCKTNNQDTGQNLSLGWTDVHGISRDLCICASNIRIAFDKKPDWGDTGSCPSWSLGRIFRDVNKAVRNWKQLASRRPIGFKTADGEDRAQSFVMVFHDALCALFCLVCLYFLRLSRENV